MACVGFSRKANRIRIMAQTKHSVGMTEMMTKIDLDLCLNAARLEFGFE